MSAKAVRGTRDLLTGDIEYFQYIEDIARQMFKNADYDEIRTPIFEETELFVRGIGEETDIVSKEMYTFPDKKGRSLTLRPEGTAPVVRALIENNLLNQKSIQKLYYTGPMFRYERPQQGRYRQFYQIGMEIFGSDSPVADAEIIYLCSTLLKKIGFKDNITKINNIGCKKCRPNYTDELKQFLKSKSANLCEDCNRRAEINPMRALDCKIPQCIEEYKNIPLINKFVCDECWDHFDMVKLLLDKQGLQYEINPRLVRGFDYYSKTVFETTLGGLGSQDAVLGGGRYDGLVEDLGGKPTPAIGAGFGLDRLVLAIKSNNIDIAIKPIDIYFLCLAESLYAESFRIINIARENNLKVRFDFSTRSMKSGLRQANTANARFVCLFGEDEFIRNIIILKNLQNGEQQEIMLDDLEKHFNNLTID